MTLIWLGALLFVVGVVLTALPPIWRARFSRPRPVVPARPGRPTLEPEAPAAGLNPWRNNWPGLAMIAVGVILMLMGAAF